MELSYVMDEGDDAAPTPLGSVCESFPVTTLQYAIPDGVALSLFLALDAGAEGTLWVNKLTVSGAHTSPMTPAGIRSRLDSSPAHDVTAYAAGREGISSCWQHVTATVDFEAHVHSLYVDGQLASTG